MVSVTTKKGNKVKDVGWTQRYIPVEADVTEGQYADYFALQNELSRLDTYTQKPQVTYKVTYDNGETVTVLAVDKYEASAEADDILVSRGYNLDDLMFSPTVEVV
jgi:S-methylmethionine-dependent homocysteine/selenocysteine methylase